MELARIWTKCWKNSFKKDDHYNDEVYEIVVDEEYIKKMYRSLKRTLVKRKREKVKNIVDKWQYGYPNYFHDGNTNMCKDNKWFLKYKIKLRKNGSLFYDVCLFLKYFSISFNRRGVSKNMKWIKKIYLVPLRAINNKKLIFCRRDYNLGIKFMEIKRIENSCRDDFHKEHLYFRQRYAYGFVVVWAHPVTGEHVDHFCLEETKPENILNFYNAI